jgi:phosphoribosylformylglycinamidine synthase
MVPSEKIQSVEKLFSESHSRYLLVISPMQQKKVESILKQMQINYGLIGKFSGGNILFKEKSKKLVSVRVDKARQKWLNSLEALITHG